MNRKVTFVSDVSKDQQTHCGLILEVNGENELYLTRAVRDAVSNHPFKHAKSSKVPSPESSAGESESAPDVAVESVRRTPEHRLVGIW